MSTPQYFVVPVTHVDLAWKRGRAEMSEMLEIVVVRLLDSLENDPEFKYHIEQAAHFRELSKRRPDLIERLKPYLKSGRLEMVGGMASTLECNLPNGECFVRNQQMGLQWVRDTWDIEVKTGWLLDTFGIHAQVPQILAGFGMRQMMASRFGGSHTHDLFRARGLDGTLLTVTGWGSQAAYVKMENLCYKFYSNWDGIEECFAKADQLSGPGPFIVIPYTENETLVSRYPSTLIRDRNMERPNQHWLQATPADFFEALEQTGRVLPVVAGDLNPEFTGCFSLRQPIRLRNRVVENRLLEAEKWAAFSGCHHDSAALEEAWWELSYVQFHDVFTGSHPTAIFHEVMAILDKIQSVADRALKESFNQLVSVSDDATIDASDESFVKSITAFNGLPWTRREVIKVPLPLGFEGVAAVTGPNGESCRFEVRDEVVRIGAELPTTGAATFSLKNSPAQLTKSNSTEWEEVEDATIENEWIRVRFDRISGLASLVWKATGATLVESAGSWLVAQRDDGNFQIEDPCGAEVEASSGSLRLKRCSSPLGQTVHLSGEFPTLNWAGSDSFLHWQTEFFLPANKAELRLNLAIDWKGEATRLRLTVPTTINSASGIYEIPFGTVTRKPYSPRTNAKGEWPAHRFVAIEDHLHGVALVNTGVAGVEVSGGTIYSTLLRAPKTVYAGMVADETSSQHGHHNYEFSIVPYAGSWVEAGVVSRAQELNSPILTVLGALASVSFMRLDPENVVLSSVRSTTNGEGHLLMRLYETAGQTTPTLLSIPSAQKVWLSDLKEAIGDEIPVIDGQVNLMMAPFEIKTLRIQLGC